MLVPQLGCDVIVMLGGMMQEKDRIAIIKKIVYTTHMQRLLVGIMILCLALIIALPVQAAPQKQQTAHYYAVVNSTQYTATGDNPNQNNGLFYGSANSITSSNCGADEWRGILTTTVLSNITNHVNPNYFPFIYYEHDASYSTLNFNSWVMAPADQHTIKLAIIDNTDNLENVYDNGGYEVDVSGGSFQGNWRPGADYYSMGGTVTYQDNMDICYGTNDPALTPEPSSTPSGSGTETPTPQATSTPDNVYSVPLSSGNQVHIVRSFTYGEIAVVGAILLLLAEQIVYAYIRISKLWF